MPCFFPGCPRISHTRFYAAQPAAPRAPALHVYPQLSCELHWDCVQCTMDEPRRLNTGIRARAGYWLNYTWKQGHLKEAWALNIMINYDLMREDKPQLNKNNTGLHAARRFFFLLHFYIWKTHMLNESINIWQNTSSLILFIFLRYNCATLTSSAERGFQTDRTVHLI